jgi:hypothetical protein
MVSVSIFFLPQKHADEGEQFIQGSGGAAALKSAWVCG